MKEETKKVRKIKETAESDIKAKEKELKKIEAQHEKTKKEVE